MPESLPEAIEMMQAFLSRDPAYEGVFVTAVRTTGIFCRPTCPARKPRPENVEFYSSARDAVLAGYRPCGRCRPLEATGATPAWLGPVLEQFEREPARRWTDADLLRLGVRPARVRSWFRAHHGITFQTYSRARRMGLALGRIRTGDRVATAAFDHGYESLSGFNEAFRQILGSPPRSVRDAVTITMNRISTPLGPMVGGATDQALCLLEFAERRMLETQLRVLQRRLAALFLPGSNPVLDQTADQLERYFAGSLRRFTVPLETPGSAFQQRVWRRLQEIPYGETLTYRELAQETGNAAAVRAAARANGENRIALLIPCHRVIGSDGRLTGYGGGLWRKRRLLEMEGIRLDSRGLDERTSPPPDAPHTSVVKKTISSRR